MLEVQSCGNGEGESDVDKRDGDEHVVEGREMKKSGAKVLSERRLARELVSRSARSEVQSCGSGGGG